MVGGTHLHLISSTISTCCCWIKALLEEAENGRMHLMTIVELVQLKWYEGFLVLTVEGVFFNAFFAMYLLSPMLTHTITSCLEEEAVHSYTKFLKEIDSGKIENVPDPAIAILLEATQRCKFKRCHMPAGDCPKKGEGCVHHQELKQIKVPPPKENSVAKAPEAGAGQTWPKIRWVPLLMVIPENFISQVDPDSLVALGGSSAESVTIHD
ncbi:hypothetical protein C5167_029485 [Papaver somniferum]|nr:hypothetical protein C5167_029485 [Papaver somniferum]